MSLTAPIRQTKYPTQENATPDTISVSSILSPVTVSITGSTVSVLVTNTVSVTGSVAVSGVSGTFNAGGFATTAAPSYGNNTTQALSLNLAGDLRTTLSGTATVAGTVTASTLGQSASVTSSQVTITASATQIFALNASTIFREVTNPTTTTLYLGAAGVTTGNGHILPGPGAFDMQFNSAALFGIVSTGSVTVSTIGW